MSDARARPDHPSGADDLRRRLKWFLLGRVAATSCFLAMVAASYLPTAREHYDVSIQHILLAVALTYAFSAVSAVCLPHVRRLERFTIAQVAYDVALISGVLYLTGGPASPFTFLYSLPIMNAAVLLFGRGALFAAIASMAAYDLLLCILVPIEGTRGAVDLQLAMRAAATNLTFALIAFLSSILTRQLADAERRLREKEAERDHLALLRDTLARTIHSGLVTTDPDGRITAADAVAAELAQRESATLVGQNIGEVFAPLKLTPAARLAFLQGSAASHAVEFSQPDGDGPARLLRCVAAPLTDTFRHPIGALYVLQNVSRLKEELAAVDPSPPGAVEATLRLELDAATEVIEAADGLYGTSAAMARVRALVERLATADATVLISGESGTGKEVVARALHARGPRRDQRFVAINCGAIPEHLMESELFGHVRGAFTGAVADRPGCFRMADGGTLFLDEIGELPVHLQVKLLRVLQERTFHPLGSETSVAVNVRIIAATNRDLLADVKAGRFREDLFYRLNVLTCELPPLRQRREDIPLLVRHFLQQFSHLHGRRVSRFSVGAGRHLLQHDYPGNIRELENIVEHAVALCDGDTAGEEHLPPYVTGAPPCRPSPPLARFKTLPPYREAFANVQRPASAPIDLEADLAAYEKAILQRALDQAGGVKKRAAELLGINYRSLRHRLQKYSLNDGDSGDAASTPAVG